MRRRIPAALVAALMATTLWVATPAGVQAPAVAVVVRAATVEQAAAAVARVGGVVDSTLDIVQGVSAQVAAGSMGVLEAMPGVRVTPDEAIRIQSIATQAETGRDIQVDALHPGPDWSLDSGSGVGVALVDTGVAPAADLAGRIVHGPDLSGEGDGVDRHGHGTFMAGLIAGDGSASGGRHTGVAPGAHVVSVKVAGRDGVTSLSRVLDAIGWVVVNQDAYGVRVLSLSIGLRTPVAPDADPLSAAVEAAWASGVTVVAASGNEGDGVVTSPGRDPWVITAGATDAGGTVSSADDTVPSWSGSGRVTSFSKPDVLAPGVSVVSLRVPGSLVDESHAESRVGESYFRGSGTSMSTAIVAGAVATLAETHPLATPDDLKGALTTTGLPISGTEAVAVNLAAAGAAEWDAGWNQRHPVVFRHLGGKLKNGMPWADADLTRVKWAEGTWARVKWADDGWARVKWADANLARVKWADANFTRVKWAESEWARVKWAGSHWAGSQSWVGATWTDAASY